MPSNGFLMIVAAVGTEGDCTLGGTGLLRVRLRFNGQVIPHNGEAWEASSSCDTGSDAIADTVATTVVVKAPQGTHTVRIQVRETGDGTFITDRSLSLAFFPVGSGVPLASVSSSGSANN